MLLRKESNGLSAIVDLNAAEVTRQVLANNAGDAARGKAKLEFELAQHGQCVVSGGTVSSLMPPRTTRPPSRVTVRFEPVSNNIQPLVSVWTTFKFPQFLNFQITGSLCGG